MALSWSHTVLQAKDMEGMRAFYTRVLGFQVTDEGPLPGDRYIVFLSQQADEHHQIGLVGPRDLDGPPTTLAHLAFRVESMAELRAMIAKIEAEGLGFRPTTHGSTWSIYFQDPEGNGVEIFVDTPWHVQQPQVAAWDVAMGDDELAAWTEATFKDAAGFGPREAYVARRRKELAEA